MATFLLHGPESSGFSIVPMEPRWSRHLEGWQLGVVAVGIALGSAILALPRAVPPHRTPLPPVDRAEERRARTSSSVIWIALATARPVAVIASAAVGREAFRRFGAAEARGDALATDAALRVQIWWRGSRKFDGSDTATKRSCLTLRAVQVGSVPARRRPCRRERSRKTRARRTRRRILQGCGGERLDSERWARRNRVRRARDAVCRSLDEFGRAPRDFPLLPVAERLAALTTERSSPTQRNGDRAPKKAP